MGSEIKCIVCRQAQRNSAELEKHFEAHDLDEVQRFPCHLCALKFIALSTLEKHLIVVHLNRSLSDYEEPSQDLKDLRQVVASLIDDINNKEENSEFSGDDISLDDAIDSDKNADPLDNESETNAHQSPKKKIYKCAIEECGKTFQHLTSIIMHERCVHSDERSFTCEICSKSFKTRSNLNVHIKMHKNQRDHHCSTCKQSFFTSSHLKAHVKIHLLEKSYKCELPGCGKSFIHLSSFKKHQAFHSGIKSHQCAVCQRNFSQICHLREHLKIHSDERKHVCDVCSKAFRRPDTLRIHQKTHMS